MRILFDTNIVLDNLLNRQPFASVASELMAHVKEGRHEGVLCATSVTTIYYFISKQFSEAESREHIRYLFDVFQIASVRIDILQDALNSDLPDYEDAVLHEAAIRLDVEGIVTRDRRGFRNASLAIYAPNELIEHLIAQDAG